MELMSNYDKALQELYDHVGFKEDWVVYPVEDNTDQFWFIDDDIIKFADSISELESREGNYYSSPIYKQRFYKKWIYVGKELTMIFCDSQTDGMKYFSFFSNEKKVKK